MNLIPLPAFQDAYLWYLHNGRQAVPWERLLATRSPSCGACSVTAFQLEAILVKRHHRDYIGGVDTGA